MKIADALRAEPSAIALGGAWRAAMYHGRGVKMSLFGTFCAAAPHQLMAREATPDFTWSALETAVLVLPAGQPSTDMVLRSVLTSHGVDVGRARVVRGLDRAEAATMFASGLGDYMLVAHPVPEPVSRAGAVRVGSLARAAGRVPWGVYYGLTAALAESDAPTRFIRAVQRGLQWVRDAQPEAVWGLCADRFEHVDAPAGVAGIAYCLDNGLWPATARVPEDALMAWQAVMQDSGLIEAPVRFTSLVDTSIAEAALTPESQGDAR
jgi:NitT/TauT family transport system substrate-binding protein